MEEPSRCDFCGEPSEGRLFGPQRPTSGSSVRICEACVRLCAAALEPEQEVPPREQSSDPDRPEYEELVAWTPFEFEGLSLEWHATRSTGHSYRELCIVRVTDSAGNVVMTQLYPHIPRAEDVEGAIDLSERGGLSRLRDPAPGGGVTKRGLAWSAEHGVFVQAEP